jgi:hypothetical protein
LHSKLSIPGTGSGAQTYYKTCQHQQQKVEYVAENVYKNYFRKASGSNISAQIYNTCTYINIYRTLNKTPSE